MSSFVLRLEYVGVTSFHAVKELCDLSSRLSVNVEATILGKRVFVSPTDEPRNVYRKYFDAGVAE